MQDSPERDPLQTVRVGGCLVLALIFVGTCLLPLAFVIGISGPLLGADLLHWKDFHKLATGLVSIRGAGTWDGIVLYGLVAAFFA